MSDSIIVANTTPLILLQKVGSLELLSALYSTIHIPEAVYAETIQNGRDKNNPLNFISAHRWIKVEKIQGLEAKKLFATNLHEGEVETMILAMELSADLCVIDDLLARKYAKNMGLRITGTLGVLMAAKNKGYMREIKPILHKLIDIGMYIGKDLYRSVLIAAKEE